MPGTRCELVGQGDIITHDSKSQYARTRNLYSILGYSGEKNEKSIVAVLKAFDPPPEPDALNHVYILLQLFRDNTFNSLHHRSSVVETK